MTAQEDRATGLRHTACSAATPGEVLDFLLSLEAGSRNSDVPSEVAADLRFLAFATLKRVASVAPREAHDLLLRQLVPWSLKSYKRAKKADIHVYRCRDLLGKWVNELPSEDFDYVLPKALATLITHLRGHTFKQACWALGEIGYRDATLLQQLRAIVAEHAGKAGDHALALLIGLGLRPEDIEEYTNEVIKRFRLRQYNTTYYMLQAAASRTILNELESRIDDEGHTKSRDHAHILGIIAQIADNLPDDPDSSDQAATLVRRMYRHDPKDIAPRLAISGNLLPAIDSPLVGNIFSDLFFSLEKRAAERLHAIYIQCLRMRESTRPRQLQGMPAASSKAFEDLLHSVLLLEQESTGPTGSLFYDTKKGALWAALTLESTDALKWLPEILDHEPNGYVQHELMKAYACFRADPLPRKIKDWICETHDAKRSGEAESWIVRTSALRVARSAATEEAFQALLFPGFTLDGTVLLDTVQALADTVLALTAHESRRAEIAEALLEALGSSKKGPRHSAAVHALLALARAGRLPEGTHERLLDAAFAEGQEDFEQGCLLSVVVSAGADLSRSHVDQLERWAGERHDRVGETAIECLIHLNRLPLNALIASRLGLVEGEGSFRWGAGPQAMSRWAPFFVGLLFEKSAVDFLPALLDVIRKGDWQQSAQVYGILRRLASANGRELPAAVRSAIVDRLSTSISSNHAELGLFSTAARIAAEEFMTRDWQAELDEWFVDARIAFAEGLRQSFRKKISGQAKRAGLNYLIRLAGDSHYGVRRSAFRALAEIDEAALQVLIHTWQGARQHEARTWAAEAVEWINVEDSAHAEVSKTIAALRLDVHKIVRKALANAMTSRRQRLWAREYLEQLDHLHDPSDAEMLGVWRYGWALARIGNDDTLDDLQRIGDDLDRAPNVRHFASLLCKDAEKQWNETRKNWPDPIFPLKGRVETGAGVILVDDKQWDVEYILWGEPAKHPGDYGTWGGNCRLKEAPEGDQFFGRDGEIRIEGGRMGKGFVQNWSNLTDLVFCGSGEYPS